MIDFFRPQGGLFHFYNNTAALPVPAQAREEEGILYLELFAQKGGDQA